MALFHNLPFIGEQRIGIVLDVHARIGSDEILLPFIENQLENHNEALARTLAGHLKDETLRRKFLEPSR